MADLIRWGFLCSPHTGGIWTVYKQLHHGLKTHGIDLHWLDVGQSQQNSESEGFPGSWIPKNEDDAATAGGCIEYLRHNQFQGVMVNALTSPLEMNLVRYLPAEIKRILIVHNITPATYCAAAGLRKWLHAAVGVSPRIAETLVKKYEFSSDSTVCIPNAISMNAPLQVETPESNRGLRLLFLGRVVDTDKGVFWLPKIMGQLANVDARLSVVGDGPDLSELRRRCERHVDKIQFLGRIAADKIPGVIAEHDVMLMTSRFEGLPMALLECMAHGCVPVATRIRGVTDFVVDDGRTGLLFPMGNTRAAAQCVCNLAHDRAALQRMAMAASEDVKLRFESSGMANRYAAIIHTTDQSRLSAKPLSLSNWVYPSQFRPGVRRFVPGWMKNVIRKFIA